MSTVSNAILLLDLLSSAIAVQTKITQLLQQAQIEGRDVSNEELATLRAETDIKLNQWNNLT